MSLAAESPSVPIEVWLVDDNEPFRRTLARTINTVPGFRCDYTFGTSEKALGALKEGNPPRVILLDIGLPGMDGISAMNHFREAAANTRIIILTVFDDHDRIFGAVCAGADGYLLKTSTASEIARAIKEVLAGGASMTPQIARKVLEIMNLKRAPAVAEVGLTSREHDVLRDVVRGLTKEEIGQSLGISSHTVDTHLRNIYQKLRVNNRAGAVAAAIRQQLV